MLVGTRGSLLCFPLTLPSLHSFPVLGGLLRDSQAAPPPKDPDAAVEQIKKRCEGNVTLAGHYPYGHYPAHFLRESAPTLPTPPRPELHQGQLPLKAGDRGLGQPLSRLKGFPGLRNKEAD